MTVTELEPQQDTISDQPVETIVDPEYIPVESSGDDFADDGFEDFDEDDFDDDFDDDFEEKVEGEYELADDEYSGDFLENPGGSDDDDFDDKDAEFGDGE